MQRNHRNLTFLNIDVFGMNFVWQVESTIIKKKSEHRM